MRSNIIISSIANVITRFVKATSMLRVNFAPRQHQWRLNLCAGPLSSGNPGTDLLFLDMTPMTPEIGGSYLPTYQPSLEPGNVVSIQQLFQRLS